MELAYLMIYYNYSLWKAIWQKVRGRWIVTLIIINLICFQELLRYAALLNCLVLLLPHTKYFNVYILWNSLCCYFKGREKYVIHTHTYTYIRRDRNRWETNLPSTDTFFKCSCKPRLNPANIRMLWIQPSLPYCWQEPKYWASSQLLEGMLKGCWIRNTE